MPRYYDMEKIKNMIEAKAGTLIEGKEAFLYVAKWLELLPAAYVVPRDEVQEIFKEFDRMLERYAYEPYYTVQDMEIEANILKEKYTKGGEQNERT